MQVRYFTFQQFSLRIYDEYDQRPLEDLHEEKQVRKEMIEVATKHVDVVNNVWVPILNDKFREIIKEAAEDYSEEATNYAWGQLNLKSPYYAHC